jgi:integrase
VADDRLSVAFQLSLYGLRRGEVLGLCWPDVDLDSQDDALTAAGALYGSVIRASQSGV